MEELKKKSKPQAISELRAKIASVDGSVGKMEAKYKLMEPDNLMNRATEIATQKMLSNTDLQGIVTKILETRCDQFEQSMTARMVGLEDEI